MRCARRAAARCRQARSLRPRAHQCDLVRLERPARHIADGRNGLREAVARHVLRQREVGPVRRWRTERAAHRIVRERRVDSEVQVAQGGQAGDRESERHARHIAALDRLVAQRHAAAVDRPRRSRPAEPGPPNQARRTRPRDPCARSVIGAWRRQMWRSRSSATCGSRSKTRPYTVTWASITGTPDGGSAARRRRTSSTVVGSA